jgi:hypothetical protein
MVHLSSYNLPSFSLDLPDFFLPTFECPSQWIVTDVKWQVIPFQLPLNHPFVV